MLEGWLRGEKELLEGEGIAPGNRRNGPAEVLSAWCAVLHLGLVLLG